MSEETNKETKPKKPRKRRTPKKTAPRKAEITTRDPVPHNRDPQLAQRTPAPVIHLPRRRCHRCGSTSFDVQSSRENPAGVRVQYCTCLTCGAKQVFMFK